MLIPLQLGSVSRVLKKMLLAVIFNDFSKNIDRVYSWKKKKNESSLHLIFKMLNRMSLFFYRALRERAVWEKN